MKKILPVIAAMLLFSLYTIAQKTADIEFVQNMYDFGTVSYGSTATHEFTFINSGRAPLIISDVKAQCACTTVEWPKVPIEAGKSGSIIVTYDTKKVGMVVKKLTISSNARTPLKDLAIKINVTNSDNPGAPKDSTAVPAPPGE